MAVPGLSLNYGDVQKFLKMEGFGLSAFGRLVKSDNSVDSFSFAVHTNLINLRNPPICLCGQVKNLCKRTDRENSESQGLQWYCNHPAGAAACHIRRSVTSGTFFEHAKISWHKVLELCLHWYLKTPVTVASGVCNVSKETAIHWYSMCREVCFQIITEQDICIGGPGFHVELDETHLFRRKYHRGRILAHHDVWVFGGICRETGEAFAVTVPDRSGATLWPIIQRRVHPDTIIMTDCARVYDNLHLPNRGGFQHFQVNHRINFVDPNNRNIYTNTIERYWGILKHGMVKGTADEENVEMYITEVEYRRQFFPVLSDRERKSLGMNFDQFLKHVVKCFPGPFAE